jgi:Uma2 family endonuclease
VPVDLIPASEAISVPAAARTHRGFDDWATSDAFPDGCRASWIRGEILIEMSPEEVESHNKLKTEVTRVMATVVKLGRLGEFYSDRTLISNDDADLSTEPDAMFVSKASIRSQRVTKVRNRDGRYMSIMGSPDWVLELVSKSSVVKDTRLLKKAYEVAGVHEYWLIDARRNDMSIQIFAQGQAGFQVVPVKRGRWKSPLFGLEFHLYREKDEFGYWEYTLDYTDAS